ncbi:EB1-like C-terminal motif containing protein, putative [Angomonas deanei]|uniref:EB1-like C-terminal motif containing protein, putative n=1 Tax=Angomonas deanei TaxID=59799 RepID=A0A7G2CQJ6_9TRYP|nr:EB1-like C-terminal motif containing protein, putative [Angomonas deanei]
MLQELEVVPSVALSRADLIQWVNTKTPQTAPNGNNVPPIRKVEQLCSGVNYVLILATVLPVTYAPLSSSTRVKVPANHEFESVANYKLVQDALHRNGVLKPDVLVNEQAKLLKGNFQSNLALLQWFHGFCEALEESGLEPGQGRRQMEGSAREDTDELADSRSKKRPPTPKRTSTGTAKMRSSSAGSARAGTTRGRSDDPPAARPTVRSRSGTLNNTTTTTTTTSAAKAPRSATPTTRTKTLTRAHSATVGGRGSSPVMAPSAKKETSEDVSRLLLEKQFYYDKLRMIENLVLPVATKETVTAEEQALVSLARSVRDVLYANN